MCHNTTHTNQSMTSVICAGGSEGGNGVGSDPPGLGRGVYFAGGGFMPCDDDEDICDYGSGAEPFSPTAHDSKCTHKKIFCYPRLSI